MSKFDGILSVKPNQSDKPKGSLKQKDVKESKVSSTRLRGKRSHPDFTQITAYIRKETHEEVMRKIYKRQEFSELIEETLKKWLEDNK